MQRSDVLTGLSIRLGPALKIYERHVKVLQRTHFLEFEDLWSCVLHDRQCCIDPNVHAVPSPIWTLPPTFIYRICRGWVKGEGCGGINFHCENDQKLKDSHPTSHYSLWFSFHPCGHVRMHCQGSRPLRSACGGAMTFLQEQKMDNGAIEGDWALHQVDHLQANVPTETWLRRAVSSVVTVLGPHENVGLLWLQHFSLHPLCCIYYGTFCLSRNCKSHRSTKSTSVVIFFPFLIWWVELNVIVSAGEVRLSALHICMSPESESWLIMPPIAADVGVCLQCNSEI